VCHNNGLQAHCSHQNEQGEKYNCCEFPGHFASGDGIHPETLYPFLQGCQGTRATDLYRIGTHLPALPFTRLSPIAEGPSIHYATRIRARTCRVNSTVVLRGLGLKGSRSPGQVEQQESAEAKEQRASNLPRLPRSLLGEYLTPLR
jgi:hypothetical protein